MKGFISQNTQWMLDHKAVKNKEGIKISKKKKKK